LHTFDGKILNKDNRCYFRLRSPGVSYHWSDVVQCLVGNSVTEQTQTTKSGV